MRKVRFYTAFIRRGSFTKMMVDGYLDDSGEIAYYHYTGYDEPWCAIILDCGAMLTEAAKLNDTVMKVKENFNYLRKQSRKEVKAIFKNSPISDSETQICMNHWTESDHFIDLTTKEGQKILKTIKSQKRKKKPKTKA